MITVICFCLLAIAGGDNEFGDVPENGLMYIDYERTIDAHIEYKDFREYRIFPSARLSGSAEYDFKRSVEA